MTRVEKKLIEITDVLKKNQCTDPGLLTGNIGVAIFLAYIKHNESSDLSEAMEHALQKSLETSGELAPRHMFANGYSGIGWGMSHLVSQNKIDADIEFLFEEIDEYLIMCLRDDFKSHTFDFMSGGLGVGIYFLDKLPDEKSKYHLEQIIFELSENAVISNGQIKWLSSSPINENEKECNLGLAHGIPSIIWFLSKCHEEKIEKDKCIFLINGAVEWLMQQKKSNHIVSKYPNAVSEQQSKEVAYEKQQQDMESRLGWCYGDLGIAMSIWQAGKSLEREEWKKEAIDLMLHASTRKELEINGIVDAGICHGTAGIAHIFNKFYKETKLPVFKETANYWIDETLKMARFEDGLAGFKCYYPEKGWVNEYGLLSGIAGIGLVLLNHISEDEPAWDRCLLLN